jgi:integrase
MRVKLKGLHTSYKKLADGTTRVYYYAWKGGPAISAVPGSPEFVQMFGEATASRVKSQQTLSDLIDYFKDSTDYTSLSFASKRNYDLYLKLIEKKFGAMPVAAVEDKRARGDFKEFRDSFAANPRKADYLWTTIARVLSVAKDRGKISVNVCERGGRLYESDRADIVWSADDIKEFCGVASPQLQAALLLALWTGQRQGDILRLTLSAYDGTHIRLKQSKWKSRIKVRAGDPLKRWLDERVKAKIDAVTILTNSRGKPWTEDGFRTSWDTAFKKTGLGDLHFHDLRGTAVTRLALAGCTVPEIAALTGHPMHTVERILEAHYLGGKFELAENAIRKLSQVYG